ncbi:glycosyl hydrolase [Steroidobacter flavus]|uniref:Glycosyl hydrolase n=1 Tax=Steroidobacter flavus TaxID=1842136 RepID=A0ABV8T0V0_9GAMM
MTRRLLRVGLLGLILGAAGALAAPEQDALTAGFLDPPNSARPRVWWHWMSGNVSAEGARLDLEWMQRIGIGGVHAFSGGKLPSTPVVANPQPFMSEGWRETFRQSLDQAHAAGMEVGIAGSPGWSQTGGPWVAPADAMKKYVWSETIIEGGRPFRGKLPAPPRVTGPFQDKPLKDPKGEAYGDVAVIAFPTPSLERALPAAKWIGSTGVDNLDVIASGDFSKHEPIKLVPPADTHQVWIEATYPKPVTIGAASFSIEEGANVTIQAEQPSKGFRTIGAGVIDAPLGPVDHPGAQETLAFPPATATRFRFLLSPAEIRPRGILGMSRDGTAKPIAFTVAQLRPIGGARINGFEAKAGFEPTIQADAVGSPNVPRDASIDRSKVLDLTTRLRPDGSLDWTPPSGRWTVLRLGWSLTGKVNSPAEPLSTGLEVDKLDAGAVRRYLASYLDLYKDAGGGRLGPEGVQTLLTDSWEAGVQNWTPALLDEFRARRGYDPIPFLPVLAGRVVDSSDVSERFLFDFRRTLQDLVADHHNGVIASELRARGMSYYTEGLGDSTRGIVDGMTLKARADIPTAEFWYRPFATLPGQPPLKADLEEAASAAHVYGKTLVAAEALTVGAPLDPWAFSPAMLKPVADEIFARGVNRILLHESHHQPLVDAKPGLRMFIFGQFFNRNDTWAEQAAPWVTYLARSSFLLQQGRFVADVAYFYGEERNLTEQFLERFNTDVPKGYAYDYINPEALLTLLSVRDGRIVTPSGMSYRVLFIPDQVRHFTLPTLRKVRQLVADGAVLVGKKPLGSLGLQSTDADVERIALELWGENATEGRRVGKGRVYTNLPAALAAEQIVPDVAFEGDDELLSLHRRTDDADIYFVSNQSNSAQSLRARFRVEGRAPEVWRAETGSIEQISYEKVPDGIAAPLSLSPHEAVFVVFRKPATTPSWTAPTVQRTTVASLNGPWQVSFEQGRGAPPTATFDRLISWPESSDPGIKYFSGAAIYRMDVKAPRDWLESGRRIELDLGEVRELAVVSINGTRVATAWRPPYTVDITSALKAGANRLEVEVVNLWPNRLIGDRQPGMKPIAFAPMSPYQADSTLLPSGLLGPVKIVAVDPKR